MSVNVSQNVQAIRKKLGFSEEQVSTYLGVTRSVLRKYESNTDSIPFDVFDKLSNLYGVDMSVFFEENMDDFQQSLVCAFRTDGITPEDMHTQCDCFRISGRLLSLVVNGCKPLSTVCTV